MWNERYAIDEYYYGTEANTFLQAQSFRFAPQSKILCLCEGEGRNGVYLAALGMVVCGVDRSDIGLAKARALAQSRGLVVEMICADLANFDMGREKWDGIVAIFAHLPPLLRVDVLGRVGIALKKGGLFIAEYYHPEQLAYGTGGPKDPDMMVDVPTLESELSATTSYTNLFAFMGERDVVEGQGHSGLAKVSQWVGRKDELNIPSLADKN